MLRIYTIVGTFQPRHHCSTSRGGDSYQKVGGLIAQLYAAEGKCIEACSGDQSVRSAEIFFAFSCQLSGWALVAPSCFVLQVRDAAPQETR